MKVQHDKIARDPTPEELSKIEGKRVVWEAMRIANAEAISARRTISSCQLRLALFDANLLSSINAAIAAKPGKSGDVIRIIWEYETVVRRDSLLITSIQSITGLSPNQVDALFEEAAKL